MFLFYIPRFRVDNGKVIKVDFKPMQNEMIKHLENNAIPYCLCEREVSLNDKCLNESIVQVDTDDDSIVDFFKSLLIKYHSWFMHSFYIYNYKGVSHSLYVIDNKVLTCNEVCQLLRRYD